MAQNGSQEKELTAGQHKAIAALLEGTPTLMVCKLARCSERTLYRWKEQPEFAQVLRLARAAIVEGATAKLRSRAAEAVDTLQALLSCDRPAIRARASEAILTHTYRAVEIEDMGQRLAVIEKQLGAKDEGVSK